MKKILLVIIIIIFIVIVGIIYIMVKESFKQAFLKKKKNKNEAIESLRAKGMIDEEIYNEAQMEEVTVKSVDGYKLKGYLIEKFKEDNRYIILVHGYSCNHFSAMPFVRMFQKEGFNILLVDQRNHGESEGMYPTYGYMESLDMDKWIDFLSLRCSKELFLGMHGQSMGAATALLTAGRNKKVAFVIDDCGFSTGKESILYRINKYWFAPSTLIYFILKHIINFKIKFPIDEARPIDGICKREDCPILFIHGMKDNSVPYNMAVDMYERRDNDKDILKLFDDSIHMLCYKEHKEEYETLVHEIIKRAEENN